MARSRRSAELEVYWGKQAAGVYGFESSLDGKTWAHLCRTRHGEGGQDVFAFPPAAARFVRWTCDNPEPERGQEIVQINLYGPTDAAALLEEGRVAALGHAPIKLGTGESIAVDFGHVRFPLGALIDWGEAYGTVFSVHLSDDGESFREVGRITTGDGGTDSFWWRSTRSRYFRDGHAHRRQRQGGNCKPRISVAKRGCTSWRPSSSSRLRKSAPRSSPSARKS